MYIPFFTVYSMLFLLHVHVGTHSYLLGNGNIFDVSSNRLVFTMQRQNPTMALLNKTL